MIVHRIEREQRLNADLDAVFAFFAEAANLERITPPWLHFQMLTPGRILMHPGALIDYRLRLHGIPLRWRTRIVEWDPKRGFVDCQLRGPYRLWVHHHEFVAVDDGTVVRDRVDYALPFGPLGEVAHPFVRRDLARIFAYRHDAAERLLGPTTGPGAP